MKSYDAISFCVSSRKKLFANIEVQILEDEGAWKSLLEGMRSAMIQKLNNSIQLSSLTLLLRSKINENQF
jgi:hypothetical protein